MAKLLLAPTKSNLLALRRQLAFAREGYDLLEQKRQLLISELMRRLARASEVERRVAAELAAAHAARAAAELDVGSLAIARLALAVPAPTGVAVTFTHTMGLRLPQVGVDAAPAGRAYGLRGSTVACDEAVQRFVALVPLLLELAELENTVLRLARELRKTQRRCNALARIFIPTYEETIAYLASALEEREREAFVILKLIRDRLATSAQRGPA